MAQVIVYQDAEGVKVIHPVASFDRAVLDVPAGADYHVIDRDTLPTRRFRAAWMWSADAVTVDLTRARGIVLAEVRAERDLRLAESDREKARLDDVGTPQDKQRLAQYRQQLRDLPAAVEAAVAQLTLAQLVTYSPAWPGRP